jgi:hypothetical protein
MTDARFLAARHIPKGVLPDLKMGANSVDRPSQLFPVQQLCAGIARHMRLNRARQCTPSSPWHGTKSDLHTEAQFYQPPNNRWPENNNMQIYMYTYTQKTCRRWWRVHLLIGDEQSWGCCSSACPKEMACYRGAHPENPRRSFCRDAIWLSLQGSWSITCD